MSSKNPSISEKVSVPSTESKDSASPLLRNTLGGSNAGQAQQSSGEETSVKPRKRDFWKFGKKQEEDKPQEKGKAPVSPKPKTSTVSPSVGLSPGSLAGSVSPHRGSLVHPYGRPGSPSYAFHNTSPRPQSPASSMIFERNVQEEVLPPETSPHLPSHVIMENHIAPALDASAEAITNDKLDPDTVEIVTHATHQPAAVTITGLGGEQSMASSVVDESPSPPVHRHDADNVSTYGSFDSGDVRRLSFISFADVVHGEQEMGVADARRDSAHLSGHQSLVPPRSPSPIRSPTSSAAFGTSPPTSVTASMKGLEQSPHRGPRGTGSPLPGQSSPLALGSEVNIETMRQALRKTGSGDLSHFRSTPSSAVGNDDGSYTDRPFR
ncbi:hypothetical protein A1O1_00822 [Capronia coronata CBS 617.96]|uniref:Uncharacterized protein n=1 Tax=Capronia coronata CBS 617.96 TaxID=1182541 RepID=W9ZMH0_9EURO|nr:uncharacterized protein A1O1_00822 [Capronia coronata CBS 617.96]EXJ95699.1 hypothetical protein A1O1_00822 [Capronia coronata CBS 617.96]